MPRLVTDHDARTAIAGERSDLGCLVCAIHGGRAGDHHVIYEDDVLVVTLPRYVARWGHIMIAPREHHPRVADVPLPTWLRVTTAGHRASRVVEALHRPHRVYVVSIGASVDGLLHTCDHVHVHVVPVYSSDDRPRDVLTWTHGVYVADRSEWLVELERARKAWFELE